MAVLFPSVFVPYLQFRREDVDAAGEGSHDGAISSAEQRSGVRPAHA